MSNPALQPWTIEQFFAWQSRLSDRYELVNGFPVRMMARARNVHNDIVISLLGELRARLLGQAAVRSTAVAAWRRFPRRFVVRTLAWTVASAIRAP